MIPRDVMRLGGGGRRRVMIPPASLFTSRESRDVMKFFSWWESPRGTTWYYVVSCDVMTLSHGEIITWYHVISRDVMRLGGGEGRRQIYQEIIRWYHVISRGTTWCDEIISWWESSRDTTWYHVVSCDVMTFSHDENHHVIPRDITWC